MRLSFIIFFVFLGWAFANSSFSDEKARSHSNDETTTQASDASSTAVEVGNKICPVSGEKIEEGKEVKYEHNGKIYNFCCKMCPKDFKKDPEKFSKIAEEEAASAVKADDAQNLK